MCERESNAPGINAEMTRAGDTVYLRHVTKNFKKENYTMYLLMCVINVLCTKKLQKEGDI